MTFEQLFCSPELAEKLAELGVKQDSLFDWVQGDGEMGAGFGWHISRHDGANHTWAKQFCAFTASELMEMLPRGAFSFKSHPFFEEVGIWTAGCQEKNKCQHADTEADARAKLLIYMLEEKLV